MLKQTARYAVARWVPGLVNFLAIALYTRLLSSEDYGSYAMVVAWVALANALLFQWLRSGVRRFLIAYRQDREAFLRTVNRSFALLGGAVLSAGVAVALAQPSSERRVLVIAGVLLLLALAWVEISLEVVLADLKSGRYGAAMLLRSLTSLAVGVGLAYAGFHAAGVLIGITAGYLVAGAWLAVLHRPSGPARPAPLHLDRELLRYGLPLTMTFGLDFVVNSSDRLLLGNLAGTAAVGAYAASYDLAQQGMTALMMTINLGAFPMAVRALELGGIEGARAQLLRHATVLFAVAVPAAAALALLSGNLAHVVLGAEFRAGGALLIPIVAVAALLAGMKAYYFDLAFQLGRTTRQQIWSSGAAAISNVLLNLLLIPRYGAAGAAWATLAAFALGLVLSIGLGRTAFPIPIPVRDWWGIVVGTGVMCAALLPLREARGFPALALAAAVGGAIYATVLLGWNVGGARNVVRQLQRVARNAAGGRTR